MGKAVPWGNFLTEWLSDPGNLANYLQVSLDEYLQDGDATFFLHEVKNVIEALSGISDISEQANIDPKYLSDALYKGIMPPYPILDAMFRALSLDRSIGMGLTRRMRSEAVYGSSTRGTVKESLAERMLETPQMEVPGISMSPARPKVSGKKSKKDKLTERQAQNKKYWEPIRDHLDWIDNNIICPEPNKFNFQDLRIKGTGCALRARQTTKHKEISAAFVISSKKAEGYFYSFRIEQEEIETEFGDKLEWRSEVEKSYKQIGYKNKEMDPTDETNWHNQHTWLSNTLEKLYKVFGPRIERLKTEI